MRTSTLLRAIPLSLALLAGLYGPSPTEAQTQENMTQVNPGQTVEIVAHGVCRRVHNGDTLAALVPHASPEEWVTGSQSSFLSNVPENMVASSCVSPEIALRRWSRPGPPGSNLQPFQIDGTDYDLTFTSIGSATRGGAVSLNVSGNRISYTPPSEFWSLGYLAEEEDTVPFQAVDAEGIAVSGTLRVQLVGFRSASRVRVMRYYSSDSPLGMVVGRFGEVPSDTGPDNILNSIHFFNEVLFDGQFSVHGAISFTDGVSHVILIDNSQAANATYSGGSVGNLNGDFWSNTILDAQISAARDFTETLISQAEAEMDWVRISNGYTNASIIRRSGTGALIQPVYVYAINSGATYIGVIDGADATEVRNKANSVLSQVNRTTNTLSMNTVLTQVEGGIGPIIPNHFAMAFHLLSPGVSSGGVPSNLSKFNEVTAGNFGTPIFAFYTGSNPSSPEASFLAGLDHDGARRHMSTTSVFGDFDHPNAVTPMVAMQYWDGAGWDFIRKENGIAFSQYPEVYPGRKSQYLFSLRTVPGDDTSCTWGNDQCFAREITTDTLTNFSGFDWTNGAGNDFRLYMALWRNPIYRIHDDPYADYYNDGGGLGLRDGSTYIEGQFTPLPPDP